jgi:hypothetical protein
MSFKSSLIFLVHDVMSQGWQLMYGWTSSAYIWYLHEEICVKISLIKSKINNGPRTDPCTIPDVTGKHDDVNPYWWDNLEHNSSWLTVSKVLKKSRSMYWYYVSFWGHEQIVSYFCSTVTGPKSRLKMTQHSVAFDILGDLLLDNYLQIFQKRL